MSLYPLRPDPTKIIVPRKHAQLLIEPPLKTLEQFLNTLPQIQSPPSPTARANGQPFSPESLPSLRAKARTHFLHSATQWAAATDAPPLPPDALQKPWLITGHQVEFYHAGVWAKVLTTTELAKRTNAIPFDLLVDHDTVAELGFDIPLQQGDTWKRLPTEFAPASSLPASNLTPPTFEQFENWDAALAKSPQSHTDSLAFFLTALRPTSTDPRPQTLDPNPYTAWMSRARSQFERSLDINIHHIPTTLACSGEIWDLFVNAWIQNADAWTAIYNQHLAAYRQRQGIKNHQHPMPDLLRTPTEIELPFWICRPGKPRERLLVNSKFQISNSEFQILPRALTLTMFTRLFLADLFIHGIGGALYDQITDDILNELFHTIPPYACVSAAWLLPLGQPLETNNDLATLQWNRHHLTHNPQLALDPFTARKSEFASLITQRQNLIHQIASSLTSARKSPEARQLRQQLFQQLHTLNQTLHQKSPTLLAKLDQEIQSALHTQSQNQTLLWREYFFALHSTDSLQKLIALIYSQ